MTNTILVEKSTLAFCDYVFVYDSTDLSLHYPRMLFEQEVEKEQLLIERQLIGDFVFVRVCAPFERLALEAEFIKLEMPLKGCEIEPSTATCCYSLAKMFTTDDEVDFVSAAFESSKQELYDGIEDKETFFRPSLRGFLVHHILINIDIHNQLRQTPENDPDQEDGLRRRGLLYLLMKKAYLDAYILHEPSIDEPYYHKLKHEHPDLYEQTIVSKMKTDARHEMNTSWVKFYKFQPLWKVRNYFGEKIAFYFAWQGTFLTLLWLPALIGIAIFGYGLSLSIKQQKALNEGNCSTTDAQQCSSTNTAKVLATELLNAFKESFDNKYSAVFALIICLWGSLFLEVWKRNRYTLAYQWDSDYYVHAEPDRPEFYGTRKRTDPVTGELEWFYPQLRRLLKVCVSLTVVALAVSVVVSSVAAVIVYKVVMRVQFNCTTQHKGTDSYGNQNVCLLFVTIIPTVLNSLSIMLLGWTYTKVAYRLTDWENHRTQTDHDNALIIKLFAFQFANTYASLFYIAFVRPADHGFQNNGIFGLGPMYRDTCERGSCMSLLSFQVLVLMLMKPFPKYYKDFVLPYIKKYVKKCWRHFKKTKKAAVDSAESILNMSLQGNQVHPEKGTEMARKSDSQLWREWNMAPLGDFTLGEYNEKVIQFGYILMFAASFPLAPLLALVIGLMDIRIDAKRLLWFNRRPVSAVAADIGMWFPVLRFVSLVGVISNAFLIAYTSGFCDSWFSQGQCTDKERLAIVIVFENFVLAAMYLISVSIPDVPPGIKLAQRREHYEVAKILERGYIPGLTKKKMKECNCDNSTECCCHQTESAVNQEMDEVSKAQSATRWHSQQNSEMAEIARQEEIARTPDIPHVETPAR